MVEKNPQSEQAQREQSLTQLIRQKALPYLRLLNVTSVGVGYKVKDGQETNILAIQFTVARKLTPSALEAEKLPALPRSITADDGTEVPVDVVQRSFRPGYRILEPPPIAHNVSTSTTHQTRRSKCDPLRPGISIGHLDVTAGTLGMIVYDAQTGTPYLLSNWHVLQGPTGAVGDQIVQPGRHDNGNIFSNTMGYLVRGHLGLAGDCAIASIVGRGVDPQVFERGVVPRRIGQANIGDTVVKSGRTTGVTYGEVRRVGVVVKMDYGPGFMAQEIGGFEIRPHPKKPAPNGEISLGGDSGSVWMVDTNGADRDVVLGLHFAGETDPHPAEEHALACDIQSVLEQLQVRLVKPQTATTSRRRAKKS